MNSYTNLEIYYFIIQPTITFTWGGWADDLSGLNYYDYQVFNLDKDGTSLVDGTDPVLPNTVTAVTSMSSVSG